MNNNEGLEAGWLSYSQKHICDLNKDNHHCVKYSLGINDQFSGFNDCLINDLRKKFKAAFNCTLPFINTILNLSPSLPVCSDTTISQNVMFAAFREVYKYAKDRNSKDSLCPFPCCYVSYYSDVNYYHRNILSNLNAYYKFKSPFMLAVYPQSNMIEEQTEALIYDFFSLLSSGGGNLGLFLGFSCLSIIFGTINWLEKKILTSFY
jgi:hypothetical protein